MAHQNLKERAKRIKELMPTEWNSKVANQIALEFNCSNGAVRMSFIQMNRTSKTAIYPGKGTKERVFARDSHTCQYCYTSNCYLIAEHVIPAMIGGVGKEYNLVASCQQCNSKKSRYKVWIPKNFNVLQALNKKWSDKILSLAVADFRK